MTKRENMSETIAMLRAEIEVAKTALKEANAARVVDNQEARALRKRLSQPKFLLAKFRGVHPVSGFRVTFDAHVVAADEGTYFTLPDGYREVEVSVYEVKA
jgi:hypothetical protein